MVAYIQNLITMTGKIFDKYTQNLNKACYFVSSENIKSLSI